MKVTTELIQFIFRPVKCPIVLSSGIILLTNESYVMNHDNKHSLDLNPSIIFSEFPKTLIFLFETFFINSSVASGEKSRCCHSSELMTHQIMIHSEKSDLSFSIPNDLGQTSTMNYGP